MINMSDFLDTINENKLTYTDQTILHYVQENRQKVSWMKISDLCNELFVSNASIVRFCQKLGCRGFSEFKLKLRSANNVTNDPYARIIPVMKAQLDDCLSTINENQLRQIVTYVKTCQPFYIYGRNISSIPAQYMYDILTTLDIPCISINWIDTLASLSKTIPENPFILLLTEHAHPEYQNILENLHDRGAIVSWICSSPIPNELNKYINIPIYTGQHDEVHNKLSTFLIIQIVIDLLTNTKAP